VDYRASRASLHLLSLHFEKGQENQEYAIFFEKIHFFFNPYIGVLDALRLYG